MSKEMNIAMLAYRCAEMDISSVQKRGGKKYVVGDNVPGAKTSEYRFPGDSSPVKMSGVAILLDKILIRRTVLAFSSKQELYAEIDGKPFLVNKYGVHVVPEENIGDAYILWAYVLYHALVVKEKEFAPLFRRALAEYRSTGFVSDVNAASMCDSFYYWHTSNKIMQIKVSDDLVLDTVTAAFRSGAFVQALNGFGLETPERVSAEGPLEKSEEVEDTNRRTEKKSDNETLWAAALRGDLILNYEWSEDAKKRITPLAFLKTYVPNDIFFMFLRKLIFRLGNIMKRMPETETYQEAIGRWDHVEASLIGSPGTGKTMLVYAVSAALGLPVWMENMSHDTDEEFAEGKTKIVNGGPQSVPTEVLEGVQNGGIVLLEEVNLPQAAVVMGALGQTVEYPFTLKKNGYETISRHPLCVFVSTMNVGTAGSKAVSEPFSNRFRTTYYMEDPGKKSFIDTLVKTSGMKRYICDWVYNVYSRIVSSMKSDQYGAADTESILLSLSLRSCEGVLQGIEEGLDPKEAVNESIVNKIAERDINIAKQVQDMVENIRDLHIEGGVRDV